MPQGFSADWGNEVLDSTFLFIAGIGKNTEHLLWSEGYFTWEDYLMNPVTVPGLPSREIILRSLKEAVENRENLSFFAQRVPKGEHWRIYPAFQEDCMFLDIETDGLHRDKNSITAIGSLYKNSLAAFLKGKNLDDFADLALQPKILVSFNGIRFDVPFIEHQLKIRMNQLHLDLMYIFRSLDIRGGLKKIEIQMGLSRGDLAGIGGLEAVKLWGHYQDHGNTEALETLLAYNAEDVINLKILMAKAFNLKIAEMTARNTPEMLRRAGQGVFLRWQSYMESLMIPEPALPANPYRAHLSAIRLLSA